MAEQHHSILGMLQHRMKIFQTLKLLVMVKQILSSSNARWSQEREHYANLLVSRGTCPSSSPGLPVAEVIAFSRMAYDARDVRISTAQGRILC